MHLAIALHEEAVYLRLVLRLNYNMLSIDVVSKILGGVCFTHSVFLNNPWLSS